MFDQIPCTLRLCLARHLDQRVYLLFRLHDWIIKGGGRRGDSFLSAVISNNFCCVFSSPSSWRLDVTRVLVAPFLLLLLSFGILHGSSVVQIKLQEQSDL